MKTNKRKKLNFDKQHDEKIDSVEEPEKETSIFDHLASNIFMFVMAMILSTGTIIVIMLLFKGSKDVSINNKFGNAEKCKGVDRRKGKLF